MLGEGEQRACMCDQARTDELADHDREVGGNGIHAVLEVVVELGAVLADGDNLLCKMANVQKIEIADLNA